MRSAAVGGGRRLVVQQWVTVDNIAAEEDGGLSFVSGEPFSATTDKAFKADSKEAHRDVPKIEQRAPLDRAA